MWLLGMANDASVGLLHPDGRADGRNVGVLLRRNVCNVGLSVCLLENHTQRGGFVGHGGSALCAE